MNWNTISEVSELEDILKAMPKDVLIFKHSFRCSISTAIKKRLEAVDFTNLFEVYLIDVVAFRPISLHLSTLSGITHESPQVLLFKNGKCFYHAAHFDITKQAILSAS